MLQGKLAGRIAIVTGGGQGIGRATALHFAREGARVAIATRSAPPGQEVVDEILAAGGDAKLYTVDIGKRADVKAMVEAVAADFGGIDIVLHNASYHVPSFLEDTPDEVLDAMFDIGVKACFWLTKDTLPWLSKSKAGRILVTSSTAGNHRALPGRVPYGSMKMAVTGFVRGAALELGRKGITVNAVEPGLTMTPALARAASDENIAAITAPLAIPRGGLPEEMAAAFVYFASDEAAYTTGQCLAVDGGGILGDAQLNVGKV